MQNLSSSKVLTVNIFCIQYNVRKFRLTSYDVRYHFRQNSGRYIAFSVFAILGIAIGIFVVFSNENYLSLLSTNNKILYTFINGTANTTQIFGRKLMSFMIPLLLVFLLGLNYYVSFLSYVFVAYQFALLVMSSASLVTVYGISGLINVLFLMLPINFIFFAILIFFAVTCIVRSKAATECGRFGYGYDSRFFFKMALAIIGVIALTFVACMILPLFLKNANFIVF